jgi:hypothetical protein
MAHDHHTGDRFGENAQIPVRVTDLSCSRCQLRIREIRYGNLSLLVWPQNPRPGRGISKRSAKYARSLNLLCSWKMFS